MSSPPPPSPVVTIRQATEPDIPEILSLVLTSYRQFPLFNYLYSPLVDHRDAARDTLFFWRRRLRLKMLDPKTTVLVAETASGQVPNARRTAEGGEVDEVTRESWSMLDWVERNHRPTSQVSGKGKIGGKRIVGFAIWMDRAGCGGSSAGGDEASSRRKLGWIDWLRSKFLFLSLGTVILAG